MVREAADGGVVGDQDVSLGLGCGDCGGAGLEDGFVCGWGEIVMAIDVPHQLP